MRINGRRITLPSRMADAQHESGAITDTMIPEVIQRLMHHGVHRPRAEALCEIDLESGRDRAMTYGQLCRSVSELSGLLRSELPPGAVMILSYENELEIAVGILGALAAGATVFPVHPNLSETELRGAAERSGACAVSGTEYATNVLNLGRALTIDVRAIVRQTLHTSMDDEARAVSESVRRLSEAYGSSTGGPDLLLQSSGTTETPRIVRRKCEALDAVARGVARSIGLTEEDRVWGHVPICHSYGVENVLLAPIFAGSAVYLSRRIEPRALLRELDARGISVFPSVPSVFEMLVHAAMDGQRLHSLRCAYSAGAHLPPVVADSFERRLGVHLGQLYGMTEIGSVTFNDPGSPAYDPASVGLPMDGVRVRIVDPDTRDISRPLPPGCDGEVAVSAPSMLTGYVLDHDRPCEAPKDVVLGFFLTGDQGHLDEAGRLTITGRLKLVVDIGGLKVNLLEVEAALRDHSGVQDCAVVPVFVSETMSRLKAFVVPAVAECPPSFDELRRHLRSNLSAHKVPRMFELRSSLPRSATGKVLRRQLH